MSGRIMPNFMEVRQGDNFNIRLQFKNKQSFVNIKDALIKMQVRALDDNRVVFTKTGEVDDAENGKAHIAIVPADTQDLDLKTSYITDIQVTFANGEVHTIYPQDVNKVASFIITQNVTE